jgi:predicted dinucleotide-binding enzyme
MTTIGVVGVGRVGAAIARAAVDAGYTVNVAASGAAEDIELLVQVVIPGARAMITADAVRDADIVVIAVPLHKYRTVDPASLAGKIVVDAMNYWAPIDGLIDEFENVGWTSSEVVAEHFRGARVVRSLNHIGYHDMDEQRLPRGTANRRALAVASDDEAAARAVMEFIDRIGFDSLYSGSLATGAAFGPGTPIFNGAFTAQALDRELGVALSGVHAR